MAKTQIGVIMSKESMSQDPFFSVNGFNFDLEQLAEGMTRNDWPDGAKVTRCTDKDGTTKALSPKDALIDAYFGHEFFDEDPLKVSLALTRYFLQTDRPLLPGMVELLIAGITEHLKDGKPWGRKNIKRKKDPEHLMAVLAIDNKFKGKRHEIGAELKITADGVKYIVGRAREAVYPSLLHLFEYHMSPSFEEAVKILDPAYRDEFIRKNGIKLNSHNL